MLCGGADGGGARCLMPPVLAVDLVLSLVDGAIAIAAFSQMVRIHMRNRQLGWTRQKVFHLMIGCSNLGFLIFFIVIPIATCKGWLCWSHGCGFILMACPQILFLAAFLLLLSFWVDLCHQANDEDDDEEENNYNESLLEKTKMKQGESDSENRRKCHPFSVIHIGSRQRTVIMVVLLTFLFMVAFAGLIWIGKGKNPIDSLLMAMIYLDTFSTVILLLGGALACYGGLLFSKMSKVRSEMVSTEMWKVASLATVSLLCFASSAILALVTNVPVLYACHSQLEDSTAASIMLLLYYLIGSSVPSGCVLWVVREMPPQHAVVRPLQARVITFLRDESPTRHNPHHWTTATTSLNQASKASPI